LEFECQDDLRNAMAKMAEKYADYILVDKPVPKYE
jgi:hypothetical protein